MNDIFLGAVSSNISQAVNLLLKRANRHGLIAGATGTGKTVTLQTIAEQCSANGIPVFMADIKGDLTGLCQGSALQDFVKNRASEIGMSTITPQASPVMFWDMFGKKGHPLRTTISEVGPMLLSQMLGLNETQSGVLQITFRVADEQGLLILDIKDLRALLSYVSDQADDISKEYGNVAPQSIAAIQRAILVLEEQGADQFFGEPALNIMDFMRVAYDGRGFINILAADKLMQTPRLYGVFLLWMLSELFEQLPEVGDLDKPKLVFFFDEAHLLFNDAPKSLLEKIEQVVRLIRSKGVGVFFITQSPSDIPDTVLAQLGNRVQHALRAFTPAQQKDIKAVCDGFRPNPNFKVEDAVQELKVGEALISVLNDDGTPSIVERVLIRPPQSLVGAVNETIIKQFMQNSPVAAQYTNAVDRVSAYETLRLRAEGAAEQASDQASQAQETSKETAKPVLETKAKQRTRQGAGEALVKSVVRAAGSQVGRQVTNMLIRGLLGGLKR